MNYVEFLMKAEHSLEQGAICAGKLDIAAGSDLRKASAITRDLADRIEDLIQYGRLAPYLDDFPWPKFQVITGSDTATRKGDGQLIPKLLSFFDSKPSLKTSIKQGAMLADEFEELFRHIDIVWSWTLYDLIINAINGIHAKLGIAGRKSHINIKMYDKEMDFQPVWYCAVCGEPFDQDNRSLEKGECYYCGTPDSQFEPYPIR